MKIEGTQHGSRILKRKERVLGGRRVLRMGGGAQNGVLKLNLSNNRLRLTGQRLVNFYVFSKFSTRLKLPLRYSGDLFVNLRGFNPKL